MATLPLKSKDSDLRQFLKFLKNNFDKPEVLRRHLTQLRRFLFLSVGAVDEAWKPEGFHQAALIYELKGDDKRAEEYFERSLKSFAPYEAHGRGRVLRDYGRFLAKCGDFPRSAAQLELALELHARDRNNEKGQRQLRITENEHRYVLLRSDLGEPGTRDELIAFALHGCRDCHIREQYRAIELARVYAQGTERHRLLWREIELATHRRRPLSAVAPATKLVIDAEVMMATAIVRTVFRKR